MLMIFRHCSPASPLLSLQMLAVRPVSLLSRFLPCRAHKHEARRVSPAAAGGPGLLLGPAAPPPSRQQGGRGAGARRAGLPLRLTLASAAESAALAGCAQADRPQLSNRRRQRVHRRRELRPPTERLQAVRRPPRFAPLFLIVSCCCCCCCFKHGVSGLALSVFPPSVHLRSYYEYIFGSPKRQGLYKSRRAAPPELTELQVVITSTDSECDAYPSVNSDESCESS